MDGTPMVKHPAATAAATPVGLSSRASEASGEAPSRRQALR
jgi:hypothetical protein